MVPNEYLPVGVVPSPSVRFAENPLRPIRDAIGAETACQPPASFSKVCTVAAVDDQLLDVTITTCCALPTSASWVTSSGAGGGGGVVGVGAGASLGAGVDVRVGVGVWVGAGAAVDASADVREDKGTAVTLLAAALLATALRAAALLVVTLPGAGVADDTAGAVAAPR